MARLYGNYAGICGGCSDGDDVLKPPLPSNNTTTKQPPKGADCDYDYPERCVHGGGRIAASVSAATADETPPPPPPPPPGSDPSRRSWPELVGQPAKSARVAIEADNPDLTVVVVPPHALVTADYRPDRGAPCGAKRGKGEGMGFWGGGKVLWERERERERERSS